MKRIWTVASCIPNERDPVIPVVFLNEASALAFLDEVMRGEWETNAPEDENGVSMPYPGDWLEAHDLMADNDPDETWGKWLFTCHVILDPVRAEMLDALRAAKTVIAMMDRPKGMGAEVNAALDVRCAQIDAAIVAAEAEGRARG